MERKKKRGEGEEGEGEVGRKCASVEQTEFLSYLFLFRNPG